MARKLVKKKQVKIVVEIVEWLERYEVSSKGREPKEGEELRAGPLAYIRLKVYGHTQSAGYRRLKSVAGDRTMEVFGFFCKFLEIAGNQKRGCRGLLLNEKNQPATTEDLAFILDVPVEQVENAIRVLSDEKVRWASYNKLNSTQYNTTYTKISGKSGNVRKPSLPDSQFPTNSIEYQLSSLLLTLIQERKSDFREGLPARKQTTLQRWAQDIDKMLRLDNRVSTAIEKVVRWCQGDEGDGKDWNGWQNNILSAKKLRKHFDKLELEMQKSEKGTSNGNRDNREDSKRLNPDYIRE